MNEFELKFEIPPASLQGVAVAMREGDPTRQRLQASYFDTADGALAAHGVVVRLRKEGRRWVQTAKGRTDDMLTRLEHNVTVPLQAAGAEPSLDLSRHYGTPAGKVIDHALKRKANGRFPEMTLLYGTDVKRITRLVTYGTSVVEIALDQGRVFAGDKTQLICELEVELKAGSTHDAITLARQWCAGHGLWMSTVAKSTKGQRLRCESPFGDATSAMPPKYSRHATGHDILTAVVKSCLHQILPNMTELAYCSEGSNHPEHIHQLRVGIRRLRTALGELGELTQAIAPAWDAALVQAFRALGTHRDYSHLALVLQPQLLAAGGPPMRLDGGKANIPDPGETVRKAAFQDTLLGLMGFVYRENLDAVEQSDALCETVRCRLDKLHHHGLKDGKIFLSLGEAAQHSVRKRLKRLRYLIEFAAPLFSAGKVKHMTAALKPVQDALGLYNDELMALHAWRALASRDAHALFGVGWLTARQQPNANRCLKAIKTFAKIKPYWRV